MSQATLTSKGQVTIPKPVREKLGLQTGDRIDFVETEGGFAIVPVTRELKSLCGIFRGRVSKPVSVEQMNEVIAEMAVRRVQRR